MYDHESLVKAIKQVDVVISTVGNGQLNDQRKIIDAIKEAGNVKVCCLCGLVTNDSHRGMYLNTFVVFLLLQICSSAI